MTTHASAEKKTFVCKLFGPRPTFPFDMSAEEAALMQAHVAYWTPFVADGTVLVLGPVGDPKGVWGLAIVHVADEARVQALLAADPVVRDGQGFRYETMPMMRALVHAK